MNDPTVYATRIINLIRNMTKNVEVILPGLPLPKKLDPAVEYITTEIPLTEQHHTDLGKFMDAWSKLETVLRLLFSDLLGSDIRKAHSISASMSGRALIDAIANLGEVVLQGDQRLAIHGLMDRLTSLNGRRNAIVHGYWVLELVLFSDREGILRSKSVILRESPPTSPDEMESLGDPRNQKLRARHQFTPKRLYSVAKDVDQLRMDVGEFLRLLRSNEKLL